MSEELSPACEALLAIMLDGQHYLSRRIEAAEAILSYEAPARVVETSRMFLMGVFENNEVNIDYRLKALKLARRIEAPKKAPPSSNEGSAEMARRLAGAQRRLQLISKGLWPPP